MALTIKLDRAQMEQIAALTTAINNLSENLAKWQANTALAVEQGFADLGAILSGGDPDDVQAKINENAARVREVRESLQTSINNQTKENE